MAKIAQHRVLVLRSGSTEWDDSERLQGSTDLPLSKLGLRQAEQAVAGLGQPPLVGVLCGPDEASVATAELLAAASDTRVIPVDDLAEVNFGLWEGMLRTELEGRFCRAGRQWDEDPSCVTPPEGECFDAFADRLLPALKKAIGKAAGRRGGEGMGGRSGVGVVLRPVADALVRCVLTGRMSRELCSVVASKPAPQWFEIQSDEAWELKVGSARPAASVA